MDKTKQYLKEHQSIVYTTLKNAFSNKKTTHAYLITGAKGAPVLKTAQFLAQCFICLNKDEFNMACEECSNCQKILHNGYADYVYIKGEDLKADAVLSLQREYNKSAVEQEGIKLYIIDLIEKAPFSSLNRLLKFIEEPTSNIVAIFTSNSLSSVLPTITSRCQIISLKEFGLNELVTFLLQNNVTEEDAYLISRISNNVDYNLQVLQDENYPFLKKVLSESLNHLMNLSDQFILYMQLEGIKSLHSSHFLDLYLDMLEACLLEAIIVQEDANHPIKFFPKEIQEIAATYANLDKMIQEITQAKLALLSNANDALVFDKMLINLLRK